MDSKFKGIAWVGNVYQKFETMCQEVDNIVNQDMVRYVENQAQTVGKNVKKFCTDVVQDLHPTLMDPVIREAQSVALLKNSAVGTYVKSVISMGENFVDTVNKKVHVKPTSGDKFVENQLSRGHVCTDPHLDEGTTPVSMEPLEGNDREFAAGQVDEVLKSENSELHVEENVTEQQLPASEVLELNFPDEKATLEALTCSESSDYSRGMVMDEASPASLAHSTGLQISGKEGRVGCNFSDHSVCVSKAFGSRSSSSSVMTLPTVACETKKADIVCISSSSSLLTEAQGLTTNLAEYISAKATVFDNPVKVVGCTSDSFSLVHACTSAPIGHVKDKVAEMGFNSSSSVLSLESIEESIPQNDHNVFLTKESGNRNLQSSEYSQMEALTSSIDMFDVARFGSLEDDSDDHDDAGMETKESCVKSKLEDSCVMVDGGLRFDVPHQMQKFRSYKKKVQDAFASKKRLVKEYEQLAIWYGDVDMGFSEDAIPSATSTTSDVNETNRLCDSEWVIL